MKWSIVEVRLATGEIVKPIEAHLHGRARYLCSAEDCPHYQVQLTLLGSPRAAVCALTDHTPKDLCQPLTTELAEAASRAYKDAGRELDLAEGEAQDLARLAERVREERAWP